MVLHGLGSMAREIAPPLLPLARRYRLIVPDRPGYGGSARLPRAGSQITWLRSLLKTVGASRPIIAAHSIGASVALRYALRFPADVGGIVLMAPFCKPTRPARMPLLRLALLPLVGRLIRNYIVPPLAKWFGPNRLAAAFAPNRVPGYLRTLPLRDLVKSDPLLTSAEELFAFNAAMTARRNALRHLDLPAVVLAGDADRIADADVHAAWVAGRLPLARLERLPGVGHMVQHVRPDRVMQAIDDVALRGGLAGRLSRF